MKKNNLFRYSIVAALAGFIFGFDKVVISGANEPIKKLWDTSPLFHGIFIMSMALWGTVVGALIGGIPAERLGRKKTLFWVGIFFAVSAIGTAVAPNPYIFSFFRFIGGLGIGVSSVVAPTYISEINSFPGKTHGDVSVQYCVWNPDRLYLKLFVQGVGGANDWRWMLGVGHSFYHTLMVTVSLKVQDGWFP
jgi:MFS family permease